MAVYRIVTTIEFEKWEDIPNDQWPVIIGMADSESLHSIEGYCYGWPAPANFDTIMRLVADRRVAITNEIEAGQRGKIRSDKTNLEVGAYRVLTSMYYGK